MAFLLIAVPGTQTQDQRVKDLLELLERVADRCRDAGNVISHIVLKDTSG